MESCACVSQNDDGQGGAQVDSLNYEKRFERLTLDDGKVVFPNWASDTPSVLWVLIRAISDTLCRGSSSGYDAARYLDCSIYVNFIFNHMHLFGLFILFRHNKEREYCRWNENNSSETGIWSIPQSDIWKVFPFPLLICLTTIVGSYNCWIISANFWFWNFVPFSTFCYIIIFFDIQDPSSAFYVSFLCKDTCYW